MGNTLRRISEVQVGALLLQAADLKPSRRLRLRAARRRGSVQHEGGLKVLGQELPPRELQTVTDVRRQAEKAIRCTAVWR